MSDAERAYAKLNLALHVRGRRADGRHDIETVFAFCEDGDELSAGDAPELSLSLDGPFAPDLPVGEDNLVTKAARARAERVGISPGVSLRLAKHLPVASGIGGGSADAAAALRLLTRRWALDPRLAEEVAPGLGSDVPACLLSRTARGEGVGDELRRFDDPRVGGTPVLLINPRLPLSTADIFAGWDGVDRGPLGDWREGRNDLEPIATRLVPQMGLVLAWLAAQPGAEFVRMSGSGATCFALFDGEQSRDQAEAAVPREWWRLATRLR